MFQANEAAETAVERLMAASVQLSRGELLEWEVIEAATGASRRTTFCRYVFNKFRRQLLKTHKIALRVEINVGYRLLLPRDQVRRCGEDRHKKMLRQSWRAVREISAVENKLLNVLEIKIRAGQLEHLAKERQSMRWGIKASQRESNPLPIRNHDKPLVIIE